MKVIALDVIRRCRFSPYADGSTRFNLTVWDTHRTDSMGKSRLGYCLMMAQSGTIIELFQGEDFGCSPCNAIDSDETIASLMSFLTLKPGDTDSEYFENYTDQQREYCEHHAETLACEVMNRFGER